jgi:group I intron endonuclease
MKYFKIYKLFHPLSDKIYIGQTCDIQNRIRHHLNDKKISKKQSWIKSLKIKYGQNPLIEIIQYNITDKNWSDTYEKSWIEYYRNNYGKEKILNMTDGGDGQSKGYCPSKEARIKTSLSLI